MSLIDIPQSNQTDAQQRVTRIRELLSGVIGLADSSLHGIRNIVRGHRAEIITELGDDAIILLTTYAKLKEAIEAAKEITVEELP